MPLENWSSPSLLLSPLPSLCPCTKVKHTTTAFTVLKLDLPIISSIRIGLQSWELQIGDVSSTCCFGECLYRGISLHTSGDWCWGSASSLDEAALFSGTAYVLYLIAKLGRLWCLNGANRCWLAGSQSLKYFKKPWVGHIACSYAPAHGSLLTHTRTRTRTRTHTHTHTHTHTLDLIWPQPQSMLGYEKFHIMPRFRGT